MIRVGVLRGGTSTEYEESLRSGAYILQRLPRDRFEPVDIFIDRSGIWHINGVPATYDKLMHRVDVIWNALQGFYGADGKVQQFLENLSIPYTGSGPLASAITSNAKLSKEFLTKLDARTPRDIYIEDWGEGEADAAALAVAREVFQKLSPPWIARPIRSEHALESVRIKTRHDLIPLLESMAEQKIPVIVEEAVFGREVKVISLDGFRGKKDYTLLPLNAEHSHTELRPEERRALEKLAAKMHAGLGLRHYSSLTASVTPRGQIYVLGIETQPSFHEDSDVHHGLTAVGASFEELAGHILDQLT